ncbi:MAG: isoprenyl transferase [Firmicutes bacterium]|nr:isoprenyl transferase [Bacillota bacterium]
MNSTKEVVNVQFQGESHEVDITNLTKEERIFVKRLSKMVKIDKRIDPNRIPRHIAFIMDGNGRWAKKRGMPRTFGYSEGVKKLITVVKRCADLGVQVMSVFAFSTENWNRPKDEIDEIFRLVRENLDKELAEYQKYGIRITTMGDIAKFPDDLQEKIREAVEQTKNNKRVTMNLCVNYGGRADIVNAVNRIRHESHGKMQDKITEEQFSKFLYGADLPDPDLIVRTSGEQRISNFLLWQMAYSEFLFIDEYWPQMDEKIVDRCVVEFQKRSRRFGKV